MTEQQFARIEQLLAEGNALRREAIALQKENMQQVATQVALANAVNGKALLLNNGALQIQKRASTSLFTFMFLLAGLFLFLVYRLFF